MESGLTEVFGTEALTDYLLVETGKGIAGLLVWRVLVFECQGIGIVTGWRLVCLLGYLSGHECFGGFGAL